MADAIPQAATPDQKAALAAFLRADAKRITDLNKLVTLGALWLQGKMLAGEFEKAVELSVRSHAEAASAQVAYWKAMGVRE